MAATRRGGPLPWLNPGILVGALAPAATIFWRARTGDLGANPIAEALNELGLMALVLLLASLACTPLKTLVGWTWPMRVRRLLGLLAFGYAALHVLVYVGLDQGFAWRALLADVAKRRFIFVGFAAFVLMVPLAITSTSASVRRLGYVKWKRLHLLVYPAALCAVIHFIWRVKKDLSEPLVYAAILGALLLVRVIASWTRGDAARIRAAACSGPAGCTGRMSPR
jgi:sulfoxide reductase heme-binding subunit YedZ